VQQRAGTTDAADAILRAIRHEIPQPVETFLREQHLLVVAGIATGGDASEHVWASLLTGTPGFVSVTDPRSVSIDAAFIASDPLYHAFDRTAPVGLLAIELSTRRRVRLNGHAQRLNADGPLVMHVDDVFPNCRQHIRAREIVHDAVAEAPPIVRRPETTLTTTQREWIANADTFFVATSAEHRADASHRGGERGFLRALDDTHLLWPDYDGNAMFLTLGNLELDPRCGLLLIDWERGATLQLTGNAHVNWRPTPHFPEVTRTISYTIERVVETTNAIPIRWQTRDDI